MTDKFRKERQEKIQKYKDLNYGCTVVKGANFGDLRIIGENHEEAAKWLKNALNGATMAGEIKAHFKCEELFDVAQLLSCAFFFGKNKVEKYQKSC